MRSRTSSESALKEKIVAYLRANGFAPVWRAGAGPFAPSGVADIIACSPRGTFVAIEAKRPGRYNRVRDGLSQRQHDFLNEVASSGGIALCVDSLDSVITHPFIRAEVENRS